MKILLYSVRPDEADAIATYRSTHPELTIDTTTVDLHPDTAHLADGYDGIAIQQVSPVGGDAAFYEQLAQNGIRQITTRTAGYDAIEVDFARQAGLIITNVPAYSPRSVAEFALMQIFRLLRHTPVVDARVAQQDFTWQGLQGREIHAVTVGIIGAGRIGGTLAQLLQSLGARVLVHDIKPRVEVGYIAQYVDLPTLLQESDVISLHVDLNPSSTHLLDDAAFAQMKPGTLLVNASRGPVIDTTSLLTALDNGTIQAAALDTVEDEGIGFRQNKIGSDLSDTPLGSVLAHDRVLLTPHVAFYTDVAVANMVHIALDDIVSVLTTGQAINAV
jgi:D-lactate dehydrogenase